MTKHEFERFTYSSSKWVVRQWLQLAISTVHLAQELLVNVQCSGGSGSFSKEMRGLKMRSAVGGHRKLTMMRAIIEADLLKIHKKLLKNSTMTILQPFSI